MSTGDGSSRTAAASYDRIARARTGDMHSKDTPFRHFNNYVKKTLIQFALDAVREHCPPAAGSDAVVVLDVASGRGGDIGKWMFMQSPAAGGKAARGPPVRSWGREDFGTAQVGGGGQSAPATATAAAAPRRSVVKVTTYECYDVSPECISEAQRRFDGMARGPGFAATFHVADCFSDDFLTQIGSRAGQYHVVTVQFAFHYACRELERVRRILEAFADCLAPGGALIMTTVDPSELSRRVREKTCSNGLYSIELLEAEPRWAEADDNDGSTAPLLATGTGYHFKLDGFVDCPEFIVPLAAIREMASAVGLKECMEVSKPFPQFLQEYDRDFAKNRGNILSAEEQELVSLYRAVVFRRV